MFSTAYQTSGTYNFAPSVSECIIAAFSRCRLRRTMITVSHLNDAIMEFNLMLAKLNNLGPNLWTVDLQSIPLVQGAATYSVPAETITILDAYISYGTPLTNRILWPMSRTEFASIPNPQQQGFPSQFWYDRLISQTINLYLTPDGNGPYTLNYYRFRQIQDAVATNDLNVEAPSRFLDAIVAELAHRVARIYPPEDVPDKEAFITARGQEAAAAWEIAATQDTENAVMYIIPGVGGYFR